MGIKYMNLDGLKLSNESEDNKYLTLDHGVVENPGNCKQDDGYKCGVFTLLIIILLRNGENRYIQHVYTEYVL